jgi:ankyrin repeat protein
MSSVPAQQDLNNFVLAAVIGNLAAAKKFLDQYPVFINAVNSFGTTALAAAATNGQEEIVELLMEKGAQIDKRDEKGKTPLMFAVLNGHTEAAEALLEKGAAIDAKDYTGHTILMQAAYKGLTASVRFLLEKGADPDWLDENDQTAYTHAGYGGHKETAELLRLWPNLPPPDKEKEPQRDKTPARDLAAERLEKLKSQRPRQSPFKKNQP